MNRQVKRSRFVSVSVRNEYDLLNEKRYTLQRNARLYNHSSLLSTVRIAFESRRKSSGYVNGTLLHEFRIVGLWVTMDRFSKT